MEAAKPQDGQKPPSGDITAAKHFPSLTKGKTSEAIAQTEKPDIRRTESPPSVQETER
jgi:hypothetical protein